MSDRSQPFFDEVLRDLKAHVECIVVVTHLVPGVDDFLLAVHSRLRIAGVIPKPRSIDPDVLRVVEAHIPILPYTRERICDAPEAFLDALSTLVGPRSFAIIDTGAYFSHVLFELARSDRFDIRGIVEDTENGHQKYEALLLRDGVMREFPCPVLSVARSPLKEPEDYLVGQAVVFSAEALLRGRSTLLSGRRALVFGYGKIGRSIAHNLRSKSVVVDVIDRDPVRQALAFAHGFHSGPRSELLARADLVFGATGNRSISLADLGRMKAGAYVFTATSGDDEIAGYETIRALATRSDHERISTVEVEGRRVFLCNDGNAVNFVHGGVVGPFIQLVQAELVLAISELRSMDRSAIGYLAEPSKRFIADRWIHTFTSS